MARAHDDQNNDENAKRGISGLLSKMPTKALAKTDAVLTIGSLEQKMLKAFPEKDAESWDRTGLVVGEAALPVKKVVIALDPTVNAIKFAHDKGADLLITHHPAFLKAPESFAPASSIAVNEGAGVWAAIQNQVALMCFHTALDVSKQAQAVLPNLLGLSFKGKLLNPKEGSVGKGYGSICTFNAPKEGATLSHLAAKCTSVFGRAPRVWGDMSKPVSKVATALGSAGSLKKSLVENEIDCVICGEMHYHDALELKDAGVCVIELGHDISEFPLTAILAQEVSNAGVHDEDILILDQSDNWAYPESIRL